MDYTDLIHVCTDPQCLEEEGVEAQCEEREDRIHVLCGLCGRRHDYPAEVLNRESLALVAEHLRGHFKVVERYPTS